MIILDSLFPVILMMVIGVFLKRFQLTNTVFLDTSDKLVYYIFFPVMLFWKIGGSSYESGIEWKLCLAVLVTLLFMCFISIVLIKVFKVSDYQAGSFAQSCYRFNTYIGVAIILNSFGEEGIRYFGLLIGIVIPLINVIAVTTLIWYSEESISAEKRLKMVSKALLSNPLIIGCLMGLVYSQAVGDFPRFLDNSLSLISMLTLPLALISIGSALTFSGIRHHLPLSIVAATAKLVVFPLAGYVLLHLFGVAGTPFLVAMIFFSLPTSTAIYVLSSQMHSDPELASASIAVSTLLSFPVLTLILLQ